MAGDGRGRRLGFPTANLAITGSVAGREPGVYAGRVTQVGGAGPALVEHPAVINIGRRPTVAAGGDMTVEVHLIGFAGDLYGQRLRLTLTERLRDEQRFASLEELKQQIARDIERARATEGGA